MIKQTTAVLVGWLLGVLAMVCLYRLGSDLPGWAAVAAFFALGFGMGACASLVRAIVTYKKSFATACLFGVLTGALPVVLTTYGFALMLLPVVALWTGTVSLGIRLGQRLQKGPHPIDKPA